MTAAELLRRVKRYADQKGLPYRVEKRRGKGSHQTLYLGSRKTIVAMHAGSELKPKTLHSMITGLGLTHKDIEE